MTEPVAYIYEQRIAPYADEWKQATSIEHPAERESKDSITPEYRNVRPLYERQS